MFSFPVVSNDKAFCRLIIAVGMSSYCRALPANLQSFCAFTKSSAAKGFPSIMRL